MEFVFFSPILIVMWLMRNRIWDAPPDYGFWQVFTLLIPLAFVGIVGLFFGALMWQMLRIALWRHEWEARRDTLILRRGLPGLLRSRELRGGQLLLEPHFEPGRVGRQWRLAAVCDGEKHYPLRKPEISVGFHSLRASHPDARDWRGIVCTGRCHMPLTCPLDSRPQPGARAFTNSELEDRAGIRERPLEARQGAQQKGEKRRLFCMAASARKRDRSAVASASK
jgi:hypothetical protein